MRPTFIRDATILTGDGRTIENGGVLIQGSKIAAVGDRLEAPFLAKKVRAKGKYITPGLIDVWSTFALRTTAASDNAVARAADGYDRFDTDAIRAALAQGVTTVYIPAPSREGFGGIGAVVRLIPGGSASEVVLKSDAAMCATLGGVTAQGTIGRISAAAALRRAFEDAKLHREALDFYKEDLEEYEKKIKERAEKEAAGKKDDPAKPDKKDDVKKDAPKPEEPKKLNPPPGGPRRRPPRPAGEIEEPLTVGSEVADGDSEFAAEEPKPGGEKPEDAKKKDEIEKPSPPGRDAVKEALLRVLDGEMPLRVAADRPEDILNALEIAETFNLLLIIDGGTGAHLIAKRLADRPTPVVLRAVAPPQQFVGGAWRYFDPAAVRTLHAAEVPVYCGSGAHGDSASRSLALRLAQLVGEGLDADQALATITSKAAALLGVDELVGRVEPGLNADLVIWSDHPLSPGARVERVFINGAEVYRAGREDAAPSDEKDDES